MATREYSKRLGAISDAQLQAALDRFDLGRLNRAEPVTGGLFGQNLFLASSKGEFVFRGAPHHGWQLPTERFFCKMLHERTRIPAPWPFLIDEHTDIFGWSFAIMPKMAGLHLSNPETRRSLSFDDRRGIARALGRGLAAMHELTWPKEGRYVPETDTVEGFVLAQELKFPFHTPARPLAGVGSPTGAERVIALIRELTTRSQKRGANATIEDADWTEKVISEAQDALEIPYEPCIVMQDYQEGNVVVERTGGEWQVSGVFDLGGAYFGDGEADLCRPIASYLDRDASLAKAFLDAFLKERPTRDGFESRFPVYMLLDRLIIWEYVQRNEPEVAKRLGTLRGWAEQYTSALESLI